MAHVILVTLESVLSILVFRKDKDFLEEYLPMHVVAEVTLNSEYCYCELWAVSTIEFIMELILLFPLHETLIL